MKTKNYSLFNPANFEIKSLKSLKYIFFEGIK